MSDDFIHFSGDSGSCMSDDFVHFSGNSGC